MSPRSSRVDLLSQGSSSHSSASLFLRHVANLLSDWRMGRGLDRQPVPFGVISASCAIAFSPYSFFLEYSVYFVTLLIDAFGCQLSSASVVFACESRS